MAPGKNHITAISTEIVKYVRIHPNFTSRPVWFSCVVFSQKQEERLDKQVRSSLSTTTPPPPPPQLLLSSWKMLNLNTWDMRKPMLQGKRQWGGVGKRELQACLQSLFFLILGKNNTGTSFHITQVGSGSLGGFWHTWKFQSKWRLRGSCP